MLKGQTLPTVPRRRAHAQIHWHMSEVVSTSCVLPPQKVFMTSSFKHLTWAPVRMLLSA